jgi:hypothetical protein
VSDQADTDEEIHARCDALIASGATLFCGEILNLTVCLRSCSSPAPDALNQPPSRFQPGFGLRESGSVGGAGGSMVIF